MKLMLNNKSTPFSKVKCMVNYATEIFELKMGNAGKEMCAHRALFIFNYKTDWTSKLKFKD